LLGFEWKKDASVSRVDAYEEAGNSIEDLIEHAGEFLKSFP
jgi:hypothetical protein